MTQTLTKPTPREIAMTVDQHLEKAATYIAKGDGYYAKAAEEIQAALDEGATQRQVAEHLGMNQSSVSRLVKWHTSDAHAHQEPFARPVAHVERATTKRTLREADEEEIDEILDDLPDEQVERISDAAPRLLAKRKEKPKQETEDEVEQAQGAATKSQSLIAKALDPNLETPERSSTIDKAVELIGKYELRTKVTVEP